jgi:hypothetical protein
MVINDRSYGGKLFRPTPEIHINDNKTLCIIATPWGAPQAAKDFIDILSNLYLSSLEDMDKTVTVNSTAVDFISMEENRLRMAIVSAHEDLQEKYNEDSITAGVEVLCCYREEFRLSWFVIGAPFMALRRGEHLLPLHHPVDLSYDFSTKEKSLPPLPKNLLGLQAHLNLESGNFRLQKDDELLLIARSYVPHELFQIPPADLNIESATLAMAKENESQPFWIATLKF